MKYVFLALGFAAGVAQASVVGISTHPLDTQVRALSMEMTGYLSQRHEMGAGARYTHEVDRGKLLDVSMSGGQDSRALTVGAGLDFELLREDVSSPRVSFKPYFQQQKFEAERFTFIGAAPTIRKGTSIGGQEFFPYLALPTGMRLNRNSELDYYAALTLGASMRFPGANNERLLLSLEANKDMGRSSDYLGCLISWVWN
jgi:hypothetical protein